MSFSDPISTYAYDLLRKSIYRWLPQSNEGKSQLIFHFYRRHLKSVPGFVNCTPATRQGRWCYQSLPGKTVMKTWFWWKQIASCELLEYTAIGVAACVCMWVRACVRVCVCVCVCVFIPFHLLVSSGCTTSVTCVRYSDQRSFVVSITRGFCQVPSSPFLSLSYFTSKDENSSRPLTGEKTICWYRI